MVEREDVEVIGAETAEAEPGRLKTASMSFELLVMLSTTISITFSQSKSHSFPLIQSPPPLPLLSYERY